MRVGGGEFLEQRPGVVRAAIVGEDNFVGTLERRDGVADGGDERTKVVLLVVAGDDEAQFDGTLFSAQDGDTF